MKLTIITGASRGLGAALAHALLEPGQRLVCLARTAMTALAEQARAKDCALDVLQVDLCDPAAAETALEECLAGMAAEAVSEVRLINNAGTVTPVAPADKLSAAELAASVAVNLAAPIALSACFLRMTRDWTASKKILNISSGAAHTPYRGWSVYCATKAGLDQFSRCVALEQQGLAHGAHIVSLAPGVIDTNMQALVRTVAPDDFPEQPRFQALKESGQLASPEAAAGRIIAYLDRRDFGDRTVADLRDAQLIPPPPETAMTDPVSQNANPAALEPAADENHLVAERRAKLAERRTQGIAYPNDFRRENTAEKLDELYGGKSREELEATPIAVRIAGRIMLKRVMGRASFATIQDLSGRIQVFVSNDKTGEAVHADFKRWDIGDIIGVVGTLFRTKTDELTVAVTELRLLTKSLRPLPEKFHGLTDVEQKYRSRYVDLITNEQTRFTFVARSRMIQSIRDYMIGHGFLEVETPMMHPIPGGAAAKPFKTHHNALDMELFLRIAPELYLKRLVVGGFEKVFEVNRNFRNEGLSPRHNPEFTMMEFYEAYVDYRMLMDFTEGLLRHSAREALGTEVFEYQGRTLDLSKPFARLTIAEAIHRYHPGFSLAQLNDSEWLRQKLSDLKAEVRPGAGLGALQLQLFEETTEADLWEPTFIIDYPAEVSPLARRNDANPEITERFELFIVGREIANGFSELNDPEDQAARFMEQARAKEAGDEEAMYYDADYIRALEYGLPPTGGCGIGIDRLVMLLTDSANIRDVILFPQMRSE